MKWIVFLFVLISNVCYSQQSWQRIQTLLNQKANVIHRHAIDDIPGLENKLKDAQSNWAITDPAMMGFIWNKPTLFSGSYLDLTNRPALFSGVYSDLSGKPVLFDGNYLSLSNRPSLFSGSYLSLTNVPTFATVATSGSYLDLSNRPTIPAAQIQGDWAQASTGALDFIKNKPTIPSQLVYTAGEGLQIVSQVVSRLKKQETYSGTTDSNGLLSITYTTAYPATPNVQPSMIYTNSKESLIITASSTTGCTVLAQTRTDVVGLLPAYSNIASRSIDILITQK